MENFSFKSVPFGGFDKQDVVHYIEQASEKAAAAQRELQEENHSLRARQGELEDKIDELELEIEKLTKERDRLQTELKTESAHRKKLESLRPLESETARLRAEVEKLRPDAIAYAQFRERLGGIECEARKRADDLEAAAQKRIRQTIDTFKTQYQTLLSTFDTASAHMTSELRKIEVSLSQLPHTMDKTTAALDALTKKKEKEKEKTPLRDA